MISAKDFKRIKNKICIILKEFTENEMFNKFTFSNEIPRDELQYWEYEISIIENDLSTAINSVCGYFIADEKNMQNRECDINSFFKINDTIADEFYYIENLKTPLKKLVNSFIELEKLSQIECGISIGINAHINNQSQWLREVCDESLLIMHLDENNEQAVQISCMQNERYNLRCIKDSNDNKIELLRIPFDKVKYFANFERIDDNKKKDYYSNSELAISTINTTGVDIADLANYNQEEQDKRATSKKSIINDRKNGIKIFFSYSHVDEKMRNELEKHLVMLKRQGVISTWHDRKITAGSELDSEIDENLKDADIILLLVSVDFLSSDYCYDIEMKQALGMHNNNKAIVIPVILRSCDWNDAPFGKLMALPTDAKSVSTWGDKDEAFLNIARGIKETAKKLNKR